MTIYAIQHVQEISNITNTPISTHVTNLAKKQASCLIEMMIHTRVILPVNNLDISIFYSLTRMCAICSALIITHIIKVIAMNVIRPVYNQGICTFNLITS